MRQFIAFGVASLLAFSAPPDGGASTRVATVIIRGGTIYDGSAKMKPYVGDVAISGDKIIYVGRYARMQAARTMDAKGLIVAPGFIDPHTHADQFIESPDRSVRQVSAWLAQGVTTVFTGVDGNGTPEIAEAFNKMRQNRVGVNVASYVGFGPIRSGVIGQAARAPTEAELQRERSLVAKAMCEGALGLSTGLFYAPQSFSQTNEVVSLAKEAARRGGVYDTHTRDYSNFTVGFMNSYREALAIGKEAGIPVHLSHIKTIGPAAWGKSVDVIKLIDEARSAGLRVTASQYPYTGNGTNIVAMFVPLWAQDGGQEALMKRLDNPEMLERIKKEIAANLDRTGGPAKFLFIAANQPWSGKYLDGVAKEWGLNAVDTIIRILREGGDQPMAGFVMSPPDVENFMRQAWVVTDSDGVDGHPREYGTFPLKYSEYVIKQKIITMSFFIRHSSGLTADIFNIRQRGYLRSGYFADVVVFDPRRYRPMNSYTKFDTLADGVVALLVNGKAAISDSRMTGVLSGQPLPHPVPFGSCP